MKSSIHIGIWKRAKELFFPVTVTFILLEIHLSFATTSGTPVQPNTTKEWAELRGSKSYQNIDSVTNDLKIK